MKLDSITISGYRSLYNIQVAPRQLTVLTGPNNSGKTNFVESLHFLAETYRHGLEVAISRKGGIENIIHRRMRRTRQDLSFHIQATIERDDMRQIGYYTGSFASRIFISHSFSLEPTSQRIDADYQVLEEKFAMRSGRRASPFFSLQRAPDGISLEIDKNRIRRVRGLNDLMLADRDFILQIYSRVRPTELLANASFSPAENAYSEVMSRIRLYQLVPLEGRRPGVPTPNAEVDTHGSNLPALVWFLRKNDTDAWNQVIDAMQKITPDLLDIKTEYTTDRQLALQFVEKGVRRPWSAEDMSDGTIQSLGMYTAIFDTRSSLILIEEPENSLHPWIIRNFVDSCRAANRQIVLTTHSPALLSYLHPREVLVAWKTHGRTQVRSLPDLDRDVTKMWQSGNSTLSEIIDSGILPQTVPGEMR